jgi:hypothetical protein
MNNIDSRGDGQLKKNAIIQKAEKKTRGGKRPGAGRPPLGNERVTWSLPPEIVAAARRQAELRGMTDSGLVAELLAAGLKLSAGAG